MSIAGDEKAVADSTAAIQMRDAPAEQRGWAQAYRGYAWGELAEHEKELAYYATVINMADAPDALRSWALSCRGYSVFKVSGDVKMFLEDAQDAIKLDTGQIQRQHYGLAELFAGRPNVALEYSLAAIEERNSVEGIGDDIAVLERHVGLLPTASKEAYDQILAALCKRRQELEAGQDK